ncbi:MAG: hypothetical protein M3Y51_09150 [Actinomycetota bacterium]|nr:hypothetical protein [Actinomycetota bacterium]
MRQMSMVWLVVAAGLSAVLVSACTVPPGGEPVSGGGAFDCSSGPVDLGVADQVAAISSDGATIVLVDYPEGDGPDQVVHYDLADRNRGVRHRWLSIPEADDGVAVRVDDAGHRVLVQRYTPDPMTGARWSLHDLRTGAVDVLAPGISVDDELVAVSSDLNRAVVRDYAAPGRPLRLVDVATGAGPALGLVQDPAWTLLDISPDLSMALQVESSGGAVRSARVVSTSTGSVLHDLGRIRGENAYTPIGEFVGDDAVLFASAVPAAAPDDGIADDGAFVVQLSSGALARLDPGVAGAMTWSSSPDGTRSLFSVIRGDGRMWARTDGVNRSLADTYMVTASRDHSVAVVADGTRATLHCLT